MKTNPSKINIPEFIKDSGLTQQQQLCLAMSFQDLRYREIAERMGISERTVKNHFAAMRQKYGVCSLPALVLKVVGYSPSNCTKGLIGAGKSSVIVNKTEVGAVNPPENGLDEVPTIQKGQRREVQPE